MAPIQKLNDGMEGLRNERYQNLRKVRRREYRDHGGTQREFQELVEEFNTEEGKGEKGKEKPHEHDKADIRNEPEQSSTKEESSNDLETLNRKASYRVRNSHSDDEPVGGKVDLNA